MIISVDIDGVVAEEDGFFGQDPWEKHFQQVAVVAGAVESLRLLKEAGWEIILYSSRLEEARQVTVRWLLENEIPYDKLVLGKPKADVYLDNLAIRFTGWGEVLMELYNG